MSTKIVIKTTDRVVPMIYAYTTPEIARHNGWTKIGYTEQDVDKRLSQQTHTADVEYKEEWRGNATFEDGSGDTFTDRDFHRYLRKLNIENDPKNEWFHVTGPVSRNHFYDFRANRGILQSLTAATPYNLREEQEDAVEKTLDYSRLHTQGEYLWNAKPRFGKTLTAYELCKQMDADTVLIVTNRPAIANSWYSDYEKFLSPDSGYLFVSDTSSLQGKPFVVTRKQYLDMMWFREMIYFSRDYSDIPRQLLEYPNDANILRAISNYAKAADVGIEDMRFEINGKQIDEEAASSEEIRAELVQFMRLLSETSNDSETNLKAISIHQGKDKIGNSNVYTMELSDESDGTRKLMALAPAIESVLTKGGLLLVDNIEKELHPALVEFVIAKFQSKKTNPHGAQIVFTTHNTDLLDMELLRKDQLYFVDKNSEGVSELYGIRDFSAHTTENIRKGYLLGKYGATPNIEIEEL